MIETAYSVSDDLDPLTGVRKVIADCREQLGTSPPSAALFFTSCLDADYEQMLAEIHKEFPDIELIGCTTDGEITKGQGYSEDSSSLLIFSAEQIRFASSIVENITKNSAASVEEGFERAKNKLAAEPAMALVLPDGLSTMSVPIDSLLRSAMGSALPIFGGSAGDGFRIEQTFQFQGNRVFTDAMPILLISGDLEIAVEMAIGPVPSGNFYPVDKLKANIIHGIDGLTALEFYERIYGPHIEDRELSFFPLAVYTGESKDFVLRDSVAIDRSDGSVSFVGCLHEPCRVRVTQITREETLSSGHRMAERVLSAFNDKKPDLILVFSCTSRRHVLGSRTTEEFKVLEQDNAQVPFFGFYCYGEIGPFSLGKEVHFHSDTCISLALRARTG